MTNDPNHTVRRNEVEATQGSKAPKLVFVLGAGLLLVIIAFALVWLSSR